MSRVKDAWGETAKRRYVGAFHFMLTRMQIIKSNVFGGMCFISCNRLASGHSTTKQSMKYRSSALYSRRGDHICNNQRGDSDCTEYRLLCKLNEGYAAVAYCVVAPRHYQG